MERAWKRLRRGGRSVGGAGETRSSRSVALPMGIVMSLGTCWLIANIWSSCDVGVNGSANSGFLVIVYLPLAFVVFSVAAGVTHSVMAKWTNATVALGSAFAVEIAIGWTVIAWIGIVDDYPAPFCPGNIPSWWPDFIPV